MNARTIFVASGAAILTLTAPLAASPLNVASSKTAALLQATQIEPAAYNRHRRNWSHCGWSWHKGRLYYAGKLYEGPPYRGDWSGVYSHGRCSHPGGSAE